MFEQLSVHFSSICTKVSLKAGGKTHGWFVQDVTFTDCLKENIKSYTYKNAKNFKLMIAGKFSQHLVLLVLFQCF